MYVFEWLNDRKIVFTWSTTSVHACVLFSTISTTRHSHNNRPILLRSLTMPTIYLFRRRKQIDLKFIRNGCCCQAHRMQMASVSDTVMDRNDCGNEMNRKKYSSNAADCRVLAARRHSLHLLHFCATISCLHMHYLDAMGRMNSRERAHNDK